MSKLAFLASFLAAFITMDDQLFDGATTRQAWSWINQGSHAVEAQLRDWTRSIGHH